MCVTEEERLNVANQIAKIMRTMRTKTNFKLIGGISLDGIPWLTVNGTP